MPVDTSTQMCHCFLGFKKPALKKLVMTIFHVPGGLPCNHVASKTFVNLFIKKNLFFPEISSKSIQKPWLLYKSNISQPISCFSPNFPFSPHPNEQKHHFFVSCLDTYSQVGYPWSIGATGLGWWWPTRWFTALKGPSGGGKTRGDRKTTSAEVTLNGGLIRELPQNPLNSGLGIILICPDV